jgi:hypothetical protein
MSDEFPIIIATQEAYELSKAESMGTKYKFWLEHPELGRCLYKQARLDLGEDWVEKVASELCEYWEFLMLIMNWLPRVRVIAV